MRRCDRLAPASDPRTNVPDPKNVSGRTHVLPSVLDVHIQATSPRGLCDRLRRAQQLEHDGEILESIGPGARIGRHGLAPIRMSGRVPPPPSPEWQQIGRYYQRRLLRARHGYETSRWGPKALPRLPRDACLTPNG